MRVIPALVIAFVLLPVLAGADVDHGCCNIGDGGWTGSRPDGHAPIGVMGDHTHAQREYMVSYRYMFMKMDGNRTGTETVTTEDVLASYMVAPTGMDMQMHMFGFMYAPWNRATLAVMVPFQSNSMDHITRMSETFTTETSGVSDVKLLALVSLLRWDRQQLHLNAGVSIPTGSIEETGDTPNGNVLLPYPMQLGSGTWDLPLALTYLGQAHRLSWGVQAGGVVRLGENDRSYTLGNRGYLTGWGAWMINDWFSASGRLDAMTWQNIEGADPDLNPMMVPTADPDLRGGDRVDALVGVNFYGRSGWINGHRLAIEFGVPVYQWLHGPQLETDWTIMAGWQYAGAF